MVRWMDRQTNRWSSGWIDRQTDGPMDGWTGRWTEERGKDGWTDREMKGQTDRRKDNFTHIQTNRHVDGW